MAGDDDGFALKQYEYIAGSFTWKQAKADAELRGGRLACITTSQKRDDIFVSLGTLPSDPMWLGGYVGSGEWKWLTGESFSFTDWAAGQPATTLWYGASSGAGVAVLSPDVSQVGKWAEVAENVAPKGYLLERDFSVLLKGGTIYVSQAGNDVTGTGDNNSPFLTIQKAVDIAARDAVVIVQNGTYTGQGNYRAL